MYVSGFSGKFPMFAFWSSCIVACCYKNVGYRARTLRHVDALTKFQTLRALKLLNCFRFAHPASAYPQQPTFYPIFDPHAHRQIIDGHLESSARKRKKKRKRQTQQTASILLSPQAGFRLVHSFFGLSRPLIGIDFLSFVKIENSNWLQVTYSAI